VKAYLKDEMNHKREVLVRAMKSLGEDLIATANRIEKNTNYTVNSLGEVQGRAAQIDAFCGAYAALKDAVETMEKMEKAK
jgi:hypothetical protein